MFKVNNKKIKGIMREKDITFEKLAEHLGASAGSVGSWLADKTAWSLLNFLKTCEFLGIEDLNSLILKDGSQIGFFKTSNN